jgi:DNA-3-methyladenine glycosylase II
MIFLDPQLHQLHEKVVAAFGKLSDIEPSPSEQYFGKLAGSIVSQQLSTKVADVIESRVLTAIGGEWQPKNVLATPPDLLRSAGLSGAKVQYIKNIAQTFNEGTVAAESLTDLEDEIVIEQLTKIKGVGRWTAEMFLIFTLGRPDIYSVGDYGLKKAVCQLYKLEMTIKPAQLVDISTHWHPQRSLASRILWKSLELPKDLPSVV